MLFRNESALHEKVNEPHYSGWTLINQPYAVGNYALVRTNKIMSQ